MATRQLGQENERAIEQVLGYLNFSSGAHDPQLFASLNRIYGLVTGKAKKRPPWQSANKLLCDRLESLRGTSAAFQDADQVETVLELVFQHLLPGYLDFHRDLLFHQTGRSLFNSYFVGRACEAVLRQGPPWDETERITSDAITQLNDYIGHRPVAALETQKIEPYAHEFVRPIPLFVSGAGAAVGPHQVVVETALKLLRETAPHLLRSACFDPEMLDELAYDPRAYDFDHPVNKRPNYHFGQWDPHHIDNSGRYRRYVVQQVTLDALMSRITSTGKIPRDQLIFEAAAVLAGTILMGAGIGGEGPESYDSSVTLTSLLPRIAAYRDAFYEGLLERVEGAHAERLRKESAERRQPFGGARQHLNAQLARYRASQLEHVHLALIFAQMGYPDAAQKHANIVPAASARMRCEIDCRLTTGFKAMESGDLQNAAKLLPEIVDLLHRAIQCGAFIDPWNIIGFDANFSLFPALENSIRDHRADELLELIENIFAYHARLWSEAAAADNQALCEQIDSRFRETAEWWHQFATHEVSSVDGIDGLEVYHAAQHATKALNLWHKAGAAAGDVGFWAPHAEMFQSPKAYAMVIDALLDRSDSVASMALLTHWIGQAEAVKLEQGDSSFHQLAELWLLSSLRAAGDADTHGDAASKLPRVRKLFDYLEANADDYWHVPQFELKAARKSESADELFAGEMEEDEDEEDNDLYGAAYEDVVYRDSTDDGIDASLFDTGGPSEDELEYETARIADRLAFLITLARMWKVAAVALTRTPKDSQAATSDVTFAETVTHWMKQAEENRRGLLKLLAAVQSYEIPAASGDLDSLLEFDRRCMAKETLLERIIAGCVETSDSVRVLMSAAAAAGGENDSPLDCPTVKFDRAEKAVAEVFSAVLAGDVTRLQSHWSEMIEALKKQPLLYVPVGKGGDPLKIVATRVRQQSVHDLLATLPRLGLIRQSCELIDTAREMERNNPVGPGAVTEFDELFKIGFKAIVESLAAAATNQQENGSDESTDLTEIESDLISCVEQLTESLLISWLAHSRTLRLSVLERVKDKRAWSALVSFIERYGDELFTQRFLNLGNVRAILHQGVENWLEQVEEQSYEENECKLLKDLGDELPRETAVEQLTLVLEAILENYGEYRDYNSTTTQSDRGGMLYTLLDFLRLRTDYDRVAWNLKPVVWAHEVMVRHGQRDAARTWRRSLSERVGGEANKYLARLRRLQKKYAMQMPTVADRLAEKFLRPMQIDRIRALVEPAMRATGNGQATGAFEILQHETEMLTRDPTGVGLDLPAWLMALEEEVEQVRRRPFDNGAPQIAAIPRLPLSLEDVQRQIEEWTKNERGQRNE